MKDSPDILKLFMFFLRIDCFSPKIWLMNSGLCSSDYSVFGWHNVWHFRCGKYSFNVSTVFSHILSFACSRQFSMYSSGLILCPSSLVSSKWKSLKIQWKSHFPWHLSVPLPYLSSIARFWLIILATSITNSKSKIESLSMAPFELNRKHVLSNTAKVINRLSWVLYELEYPSESITTTFVIWLFSSYASKGFDQIQSPCVV